MRPPRAINASELQLLRTLVTFPTDLAISGERRKLNTIDARTIPTTNLGNLSQMRPTEGLVSLFVPWYVHIMEMKNAARPRSTFWDDFTIIAVCSADVYETRRSLQGDNAPQVALPHPQSTTSQQDICHRARRKAAESAGATQKNRLLSEKTPQ